MKFKIGDKVKVVSLSNTFGYAARKKFLDCLCKTFTVRNTEIIHDSLHETIQSYITVKENDCYWNTKDLILVNNTLEIE